MDMVRLTVTIINNNKDLNGDLDLTLIAGINLFSSIGVIALPITITNNNTNNINDKN